MFLLADFLLMPMVAAAGIYLWPKTPLARRVLLKPPTPEEIEASHSGQRLDHLIGQLGRALTPLRPSGMVDFDGRRLDGLAEERADCARGPRAGHSGPERSTDRAGGPRPDLGRGPGPPCSRSRT